MAASAVVIATILETTGLAAIPPASSWGQCFWSRLHLRGRDLQPAEVQKQLLLSASEGSISMASERSCHAKHGGDEVAFVSGPIGHPQHGGDVTKGEAQPGGRCTGRLDQDSSLSFGRH